MIGPSRYHSILNAISEKVRGTNTASYWDYRFKKNWEESNGRLQTVLFAVGFILLEEDFDVKTILDYGCGCGDSLPVLKIKYPSSDLFFYDLSKVAMVKAEVFYGDIARPIPMPTQERFDLVYCSNVIEHVPDPVDFCRHLLTLSGKYIVIQGPYNERHQDGSLITIEKKKGEHIHTCLPGMLDELNELVTWKTSIKTIPYASVGLDQIFYLGRIK